MNIVDLYKKLQSHPLVGFVAVALVFSAIGYFVGHSNAPTKVVEVEKQVVVVQEKVQIVTVEKTTDNKDKTANLAQHVHKEHTEHVNPDGSKDIKDVTDTNVNQTIHDVEIKYVDRTNTVEKQVEVIKTVTVTKEVTRDLPQWTGTARLGIDFAPFRFTPLVVGAELDRRIIGPFKFGLWGELTTDIKRISGGAAVSVEW